MPAELAITGGFFTPESLWLITTRRIVSQYRGELVELDPRHGVRDLDFPKFKLRTRDHLTEVATVVSARGGDTLQFEFETGAPAMAPLNGCSFWRLVSRFHYRDGAE